MKYTNIQISNQTDLYKRYPYFFGNFSHKFLFYIFLGFLIFLPLEPASGNNSNRKLTIMVYMCGSNLESLNGAASNDIQEMKNAGISDDISLLVMVGGSKYWSMGFDTAETVIYEISSKGSRIVKTFDKKNMGSQKTLTDLLVFGKENRTADNYALILWDHGGGPLEGVCWDELFPGDHLYLNEITVGIRQADLGKKLSWIGFDACLMSSLEVAAALEPYAEYMIASQETEPVFGWNYSFLNGIESDSNGAETGRRIIDAFFEGQEDNKDILTLSCIDLSKAAQAVLSMDSFFRSLSKTVNKDNFPQFSQLRMISTGFGKGYRSYDEDSFDLVDAIDFISHLDIQGKSELSNLIQDAIVYSYSNAKGANGLSLYHPFQNKDRYIKEWRKNYNQISLCPGYTSYIKAFASILTGKEIVDWSNLVTRNEGFDAENKNHFSLQLTPEQAANFSSAKLYILRWHESEYSDSIRCYPVYIDNAVLDSNGTLSGTFSGKLLYIEADNGFEGPIGFRQTTDGIYDYILVNYSDSSDTFSLGEKNDYVLYFLDAADQDPIEEIVRTRVYDKITETYTNRLSFSEEDFYKLRITNNVKRFPGFIRDAELPSFGEWESVSDLFYQLPLPSDWNFGFRELQTAEEVFYAMFEITDSQQNLYCSQPILMDNSYLKEINIKSNTVETDQFHLELSGQVMTSPQQYGLSLQMKITNTTDEDIRISGESFILNGNRIANNRSIYLKMAPGEIATENVIIDSVDLIFLNKIESLSFSLKVTDSSFNAKNYPIQFAIENCDISHFPNNTQILAESSGRDITIRLLSLSQDKTHSDFNLILYAENNSDQIFDAKMNPLVNGIQEQPGYAASHPIMPGKSGIIKFSVKNQISGSAEFLSKFAILSSHIQQEHGFKEISDIDILYTNGSIDECSRKIHLKLNTPFPIEWEQERHASELLWDTSDQEHRIPEREILADNDEYTIKIEKIFIRGEKMISLLEFTNKTSYPLDIIAENALLKGSDKPCEVSFRGIEMNKEIILMPNSISMADIHFDLGTLAQDSQEIQGFSIVFREKNQRSADQSGILFKTPVAPGTMEAVWKKPKDFTVDAAYSHNPKSSEIIDNAHGFEPELSMPSDTAALPVWLKAPLTEYQKKQLSTGKVSLVKKDYGNLLGHEILQIIATQKTVIRDDGSVGALFSGLIPYIENAPDVYLYAVYEPISDNKQNIRIDNVIGISEEHIISKLTYRSMMISADFSDNTSQLVGYRKEGSDFAYQNLMRNALINDYVVYRDLDKLKPFTLTGSTKIPIYGEPIKLGLRPISEDEDLYVLFSLVRKGGTGYSLPLMSYSEFLKNN